MIRAFGLEIGLALQEADAAGHSTRASLDSQGTWGVIEGKGSDHSNTEATMRAVPPHRPRRIAGYDAPHTTNCVSPLLAASLSLFLAILISTAAMAQRGGWEYQFKAGTLPVLTDSAVGTLRTALRGPPKDWGAVLERYFGGLYDSSLADLVVYLQRSESAKQALIWNGEIRDWLPGQRNVWLIVFSDSTFRPPPGDSVAAAQSDPESDESDEEEEKPDSVCVRSVCLRISMTSEEEEESDTVDLRVSITSIEHQRDRFLVALVKSVATAVIGGVTDPESATGQDTIVDLVLKPINSPGLNTLYIAVKRFDLAENTINRISIRPATGPALGKDRSVHFNFGNASASRFAVSLAGGATFNAHKSSFNDSGMVTGRTSVVRTSLYLFGHAYLIPPRLPWIKQSLGLALGTNILRGGLLDDIVVGLSYGRLIGDIGLIVGMNWMEDQRSAPIMDGTENATPIESYRKPRFFLGLDFAM
jgi:hypothetical protein